MKEYPAIASSVGQKFSEFDAHIFDKLDGSNLRFELKRKTGLVKQGTRTRLFDKTDPVFGHAIDLFLNTRLDPMMRIVNDLRLERMIVFAEFWGAGSFAGLHDPIDEKHLTIIDVNPYKKGILGPAEFLSMMRGFEPPFVPRYLGRHNWTRGFVERVRNGEIEGVTFEGVVGKAGAGHGLHMAKAKTQRWIDQVHARFSAQQAEEIISS